MFGKYKILFQCREIFFFKSLKAKKTISTGKPTQKKASQNTFLIIFWNTFDHCTGGKSTSILCLPPQASSAEKLPKPFLPSHSSHLPPWQVFVALFVWCFQQLGNIFRAHPEIPSGAQTCLTPQSSLKELSQESSYLAFLSPFPQILLKRTLTLHFDLQEHFCCTSVDLTSSSYFIHLLNQQRPQNFYV